LINFCGKSFTFDCSPDTMTTLRNKFALGKEVYRPKKKTLIYRLEITAEEQAELEILKLDAPKAPKSEKRKKIPEWEILGVSKSTYYRREERAKKITAKLRVIYSQYFSLLWIMNKMAQQEAPVKLSIQMRLKNSAYYDRGEVAGRRGRRSEFILLSGGKRKVFGKDDIQELERPPPTIGG
ncbi:MAG: hypothetical protein IJP69_07050, partial [Synergistaceae bacterium]|nr:hypothetical protein [Synergistaceae bacterium]